MQRLLRRTHLYLGVFFAPLLIFFTATGWYQTVNIDRLKSPGEAETLAQKLRVVHTDQIYPTETEFSKPSSAKAFQWLVVVMSVALLITTALGLWLAFKTTPKSWPVWISLVLGLLVPVLLLWLGQGR
jgi:hypothetical protein